MIYVERIWRGLQLGLDFFFLRLLFLALIDPDIAWYWDIINWLFLGAFVAMALDDFMLLQDLLRKPRKKRGAGAD